MKPSYVYVASSWRNPIQPAVCAALAAHGIDHYDFKNPPGNAGFGWEQVRPDGEPSVTGWCIHCGVPVHEATYRDTPGSRWEPSYDPNHDPVTWRHEGGYASCADLRGKAEPSALKPKGSDWVSVDTYKWMVEHPRAIEGFHADFGAMQMADTFVLVLPCGKSAHLELGWAVGAGKRTAILLEDPVEPELMYRMVDHMATDVDDLIDFLTSNQPKD